MNNTADKSFEALVSDAIDHIPSKYREKIKDVAFMVEDEPTLEQRKKLGLRKCDALYGLYEGVPLTRRNGNILSIPPDIITIFKHPMVHIHNTEELLRKQIYKTVWHEVAHYFGLNHAQIHKASQK